MKFEERRDNPDMLAEKVQAAQAQKARAEGRFPAGAAVTVNHPIRGDVRGVVVGSRSTDHYGVVVIVRLHNGETWHGTAQRVSRMSDAPTRRPPPAKKPPPKQNAKRPGRDASIVAQPRKAPVVGDQYAMAAVVAHVMSTLGVEYEELAGKGKRPECVMARELITVFVRRYAPTVSYPEIARAIGRSGHSTLITAEQRLNEILARPESEQPAIRLGDATLTMTQFYWRLDGEISAMLAEQAKASDMARRDAARRRVPHTEIIPDPAGRVA